LIPTPERLEEISNSQEGSLREVPFSPLLCALAIHQRTAVLEIRRRQVWKKIVLEAGTPIDCRSNLVHETLGRYMVIEGKLSEEDFNASLGRSAARGVPMGEVLLESGLVNAVELFKILQQNLAKKLLDMFTWTEGDFRLLPEDDTRSDSSLKVKVPQLILTGVTKLAPQEEVDMAVAELVGKRLALHPSPPFPLDDLRLTRQQSLLTEAVRPGRRMSELAEATGLPVDEITRLLYALSILGVVVPGDSLPQWAVAPPIPVAAGTASLPRSVILEARSAAGSAPAPPVPAGPAARGLAPDLVPDLDAAEVERRRNQIMQAFLTYRRQDAFDLLGVPETASLAEIEERFLAFAEKLAPWSLHRELLALEDRVRDLFLAAARSYAELADTEQRNTLLFRRKTLREEREKKPSGFGGIKTDLLDSEAQFRKGLALLEAGKPREALQYLEFAADCDPQNGVYRAELAWSRFLWAPSQAAQSLKELQEALRLDANCGLAAYYAGEIHRQLGNWDDAESHLRRAIKLMSPDRRPIDALKTLSSERKR
jgi:Domain of unknown function (DUF4388)/Tetratricopeptide repeat